MALLGDAHPVKGPRAGKLTLRGFKDIESWGLETYSGTSSRISKRLVVSEAVMRDFVLVAMDVKKAFLKGVTYKELASLTGKECELRTPDLVLSHPAPVPAVRRLRPEDTYSTYGQAGDWL